MDISKTKLIYSEKYNQHYKPIKFDEENKICYIMVVKNRRDKSIHRDMIARIEKNTDWKFVVMRNQYITAEDNFIRSMRCDGQYMRKLNELHDFKRNGLVDSENAVDEIRRLYSLGYTDVKNRDDRKFRQAVIQLYLDLCVGNVPKQKNKDTYAQHIPGRTKDLAKKKGLFIERVDDYCIINGKRCKAYGKRVESIRKEKPCGYLIRNTDGKVIVGGGYKLSDEQVVAFIDNYEPEPDEHVGNYKVPLSKNEEKRFAICRKILRQNKLKWKNDNNVKFWVLDNENVIYGGKDGVGLKGLFRYCNNLKNSHAKGGNAY